MFALIVYIRALANAWVGQPDNICPSVYVCLSALSNWLHDTFTLYLTWNDDVLQ